MFKHVGIRHFTVMQRLLKVRLPLLAALDDPSQKKCNHLLLRDKQWSLMEELVEVLDPVEVATTVLSGQQYATASLVLPIVTNLVKSLTSQQMSTVQQSSLSGLCWPRSYRPSLPVRSTSQLTTCPCYSVGPMIPISCSFTVHALWRR